MIKCEFGGQKVLINPRNINCVTLNFCSVIVSYSGKDIEFNFEKAEDAQEIYETFYNMDVD